MAATNSIPKELGDFEILRELGRGGMGVVYEARQKSLDRRVALKVLASSLGLTAKAVMRFKREAEAAAKLHHTNIVPIYFTGEEEGVYFYAMELIDGPSLDQVIRHMRAGGEFETSQDIVDETADVSSEPIPEWVDETIVYERPKGTSSAAASNSPKDTASGSSVATGAKYFDQVATMIADVADALQHAHDHGVISRDIKPSNLLLGSDGNLSVTDFGLARVLEQPGMTMSGEFVGTPRYMSPEQISAGRAPLDHRTDIYSLGATLYELLTLQPPFTGQSRDEVIGQILHKEPKSPRSVNRSIPKDLETICLKAMERDPDRRYQHAGEMGKDLRAFVNRFAISAKRDGMIRRTWKLARRNPASSLGTVVAAILLALLASMVVREGWKNKQLAIQAEIDKATLESWAGNIAAAELHLDQAVTLGADAYELSLLRAHIHLNRGDYDIALDHLKEAEERGHTSVASASLLAILSFMAGDEIDYFERLEDIYVTREDAESFADFLFLGMAYTWGDSRTALESLRKAEELRPASTPLKIVMSVAEANTANNETVPEAALEHALRAKTYIDAAIQSLPNNSRVMREYVYSRIVLANVYGQLGDARRRGEALAEAESVVRQLESHTDLFDSLWARVMYLDRVGETNASLDLICQAPSEPAREIEYLRFLRSNAWFRKNDVAEAEASLDGSYKMPEVRRFFLAFLRMATIEDDESKRLSLLEDYGAPTVGREGVFSGMDWAVYRLLRDDKFASESARIFREHHQGRTDPSHRFMVPIADLMIDCLVRPKRLEPDEVAERFGGTQSELAHAHFFAGVNELASGRRENAASHFEACTATTQSHLYVYWWSRAFAEHMARDRDWPAWIEGTDEQSE